MDPRLVPNQARESPTESASSRDTSPTADGLVMKKLENDRNENDCFEQSVVRRIFMGDKITLRNIAEERVDIISEKMQILPDEYVEELKNGLRVILEGNGGSQQREEFMSLQKLVQTRSDLTMKTLLRAHRAQLEILVAIKMGIQAFLHPNVSLSQTSLVEIFAYKRCRNIACQNQLPVDDCTCEICTNTNGFCNVCMCVICTKFDFEVNTCRWIGCDLCSHWTHTDCAIRDGLICMGTSTRTGMGQAEMLFRCRACNRTSELLGWVKDVFQHCAPSWNRASLMTELDIVGRIFRGSEDVKGRKLFWKCEELIEKMKSGLAESTACRVILLFFQVLSCLDFVPYVGVLELNLFVLELKHEGRFGIKLKLTILRTFLELEADSTRNTELGEGVRLLAPQEACKQIAEVVQEAIRKMEMVADEKLRMLKKARLAVEACEHELEEKAREVAELKLERQRRKQKIDELESIVKLKQAEADMFQLKADEARREAEMLQNIALAKSEKSEEDYRNSYLKLKLSEAEAEKQYLFQKMKLQESSRPLHANDGNDSSHRFSKIQDALKNAYNVSSSADCPASDRNSGRKNP
ncbi:hypothetical protein Cgig2_027759 [Carnegiea gigantea]|uniref:OBERON-like protein n=1 Tax=Carnegiea gigantea TaxID=171969 RepID=A0A9Q1Q840_9CARY|nr:hypothetical protein Cgig2_027759 [Carnegiea gigantea]